MIRGKEGGLSSVERKKKPKPKQKPNQNKKIKTTQSPKYPVRHYQKDVHVVVLSFQCPGRVSRVCIFF